MATMNMSQPSTKAIDYSWTYAIIANVKTFSALYSLVLFAMAVICNPLSFIILSRKAFRNSNISIYLRCLTISDTTALTLITTRYATSYLVKFNILHNDIVCKAYFYGINVALYSSSWILLTITLERVIAIVKPHSVQVICSQNKAKITMVSLIIIWTGALVFFPLYHSDYTIYGPNRTVILSYQCIFLFPSMDAYLAITMFDNLMFAFVPSVLLVVFSVIIVIGLKMSRKNIKSFSKQSSADEKDQTTAPGSKSATSRTSKDAAMTRTILCVNLCFVLCNFPYCVYSFWPFSLDPGNEYQYFIQDLCSTILVLLVYTNNALNFVMYFVTGSKFRQELRLFIDECLGKSRKTG